MPYKTMYQRETSDKIPNSLNDPYNPTSYFNVKEDFIPFNYGGGGGGGESQLRNALIQQQAEQNQIVQQIRKQQLEKQQDEEAVKNTQKLLILKLYQNDQEEFDEDTKIIKHLNEEIDRLDRLIEIARS